ncbi:MAG TPA: hypothetical protein VGQ06_08370 [Gemmatimonadales bacterium]|jgi:hypothetical protein|nr:hypothetical protein [Gemmatimonadales bacterium]
MTAPELDRRDSADRRSEGDRRRGAEELRREGERRKSERRVGIERRLALQSSAGQMQIALGLLARTAEAGTLTDEQRRLLDTAMLRLRFAIERIERE